MDIGSFRDIITLLKRSIKQQPLVKEEILVKIAYQILNGLSYLHNEKHQIHRDIKPENILMNSQGQIKLTDFGISKNLEKTQAMCKTYVGTQNYMSPERIEGKEYGVSSDIWSFGLMLIELTTGVYPYPQNKSQIEQIQNVLFLPAPNLPDKEWYSSEFKDFIYRCVNKDCSQRYTAQQLMEHQWIKRFMFQECESLADWILKIIVQNTITNQNISQVSQKSEKMEEEF